VRFAYIILTYLLTPAGLLHLLWRSLSAPAYRRRIGERFGRGMRRLARPSIWIHAVSVGEVQAATALVHALQRRYPDKTIVVTTITPTGSQRVQALFGDSVVHSYAPFDVHPAVRRFFDWARPELAIIMETELWPNMYHECGVRRVPLVLASARVSERSLKWYRRLAVLFREALSNGIVIAAQSEMDAQRFLSLGSGYERTYVTGNIKFDFELAPDMHSRGRAFREEQAAGRPVWIAASTHHDEEEVLLEVHRRVLEVWPQALLLLVPRHPERFASVAALIDQQQMPCVTRSSGARCTADTQVFLGDSMGELQMFYAAADVAFVAGSLLPIGGHNLLEPAALGIPTITGPHNFSSPDIAELLQHKGAAFIVGDAEELADKVIELLGDPVQRRRCGGLGKETVENNRGALDRLLNLIEPLVADS